MAVLAKVPQIGNSDFVFTTDGKTPISGFSKFKRAFDLASDVSGWTLHNLRRTARSLMSRAGVPSDHAERALGHVIGGIRSTYDRHEFYAEKKHAFAALAAQIERILRPQDNVIPFGVGDESAAPSFGDAVEAFLHRHNLPALPEEKAFLIACAGVPVCHPREPPTTTET